MAFDKTAVIVLRGTLDYAKVIGAARPHTGQPKYDKGPAWSVDVTPDEASKKLLEKYAIDGKLREPNTKNPKEHRKEPFLSLKILENKADGTKNKPPKIVDVRGSDWDDSLIGNGTVADVKVRVVDYGKGVEKGCYLQALRILDHVPYEPESFTPLSEDDKYFAEADEAEVLADTPSEVSEPEVDEDVPY